MLNRAALAAALLLFAVPAAAQELQPLAEWTKGPEAKAKPDYLYTRCAALYLAIIKYDGISYARADLEHMKKTAVAFASTAAKTRSGREGGKPEDYIGPIAGQAETMADQYGGRIVAARQKGGRALDTDPVLAQDDEICRKAAGTPKKS
ncbi:MAG: hypothetical protein ACYC1L_16755 [Alphaproteobacteria bacterium]